MLDPPFVLAPSHGRFGFLLPQFVCRHAAGQTLAYHCEKARLGRARGKSAGHLAL